MASCADQPAWPQITTPAVVVCAAGPVGRPKLRDGLEFIGRPSVPGEAGHALAAAGLDAIESGLDEVLADDWARLVKSGLTLDPSERYKQLFSALAGS